MTSTGMPSPVAKRLGYVLKRAQHALRLNMDDALKPVGLTMAQYAVMCALEAEPGMSNARLARSSFVTAQTMQGVLSNLERAGIVIRTPDPENARVLRTVLSVTGKEVLARAHHAVAVVEATMVASVGTDKVGALAETLARAFPARCDSGGDSLGAASLIHGACW